MTVEVKYIGKAEITIRAEKTSQYRKAEKKITVTVNPTAVEFTKIKQSLGLTVKLKFWF